MRSSPSDDTRVVLAGIDFQCRQLERYRKKALDVIVSLSVENVLRYLVNRLEICKSTLIETSNQLPKSSTDEDFTDWLESIIDAILVLAKTCLAGGKDVHVSDIVWSSIPSTPTLCCKK